MPIRSDCIAFCSGFVLLRVRNLHSLILADESTANLDEDNKHLIGLLLLRMKQNGKTIIMVTHDPDMAKLADRIVYLKKDTAIHIPSESETAFPYEA